VGLSAQKTDSGARVFPIAKARKTPEALNPDRFGINNHVWRNDTSPERAAPSLINGGLDAEELMPKVLSETTDPVCTTTVVNNPAVSAYD
jgi:hypothetical protein